MPGNSPLLSVLKTFADILLFTLINIWVVIDSVLLVGGIILCIMMFNPWPMKFVYMALWIVIIYSVSRIVTALDNYRKSKETDKGK
jgi:hypothetical protein